MTRIALARVDGTHPAFVELTRRLDAELRERYGDIQDFFDAVNAASPLTHAILLSDTSGFVACGALKPYDDTTGELKRMFVRADRRRRGFAQAVIAGLEDWARELGFTTMLLETGNLQPDAVSAYGRAGYERCERYPPYVDQAVSICMKKSLQRG